MESTDEGMTPTMSSPLVPEKAIEIMQRQIENMESQFESLPERICSAISQQTKTREKNLDEALFSISRRLDAFEAQFDRLMLKETKVPEGAASTSGGTEDLTKTEFTSALKTLASIILRVKKDQIIDNEGDGSELLQALSNVDKNFIDDTEVQENPFESDDTLDIENTIAPPRHSGLSHTPTSKEIKERQNNTSSSPTTEAARLNTSNQPKASNNKPTATIDLPPLVRVVFPADQNQSTEESPMNNDSNLVGSSSPTRDLQTTMENTSFIRFFDGPGSTAESPLNTNGTQKTLQNGPTISPSQLSSSSLVVPETTVRDDVKNVRGNQDVEERPLNSSSVVKSDVNQSAHSESVKHNTVSQPSQNPQSVTLLHNGKIAKKRGRPKKTDIPINAIGGTTPKPSIDGVVAPKKRGRPKGWRKNPQPPTNSDTPTSTPKKRGPGRPKRVINDIATSPLAAHIEAAGQAFLNEEGRKRGFNDEDMNPTKKLRLESPKAATSVMTSVSNTHSSGHESPPALTKEQRMLQWPKVPVNHNPSGDGVKKSHVASSKGAVLNSMLQSSADLAKSITSNPQSTEIIEHPTDPNDEQSEDSDAEIGDKAKNSTKLDTKSLNSTTESNKETASETVSEPESSNSIVVKPKDDDGGSETESNHSDESNSEANSREKQRKSRWDLTDGTDLESTDTKRNTPLDDDTSNRQVDEFGRDVVSKRDDEIGSNPSASPNPSEPIESTETKSPIHRVSCGYFEWKDGQKRRAPENWLCPASTCKTMWCYWFLGDSVNRIGPFRYLKSKDVNDTNSRNLLARGRTVMEEIIRISIFYGLADSAESIARMSKSNFITIFDKSFDLMLGKQDDGTLTRDGFKNIRAEQAAYYMYGSVFEYLTKQKKI